MKTDTSKPTRLRILILGNAAPHRIGGAEVQIRHLADGFHQCGHEVTVAGYSMPQASQAHSLAWNSMHLPVRGRTRGLRAISFACALGCLLVRQRHDFDVVYGRVLGESILVAAALKYMGLIHHPLVACSACSGRSGDAANLASLPASKLLVYILNRACNAINILSPTIAKELQLIGLNPNIFTAIPNGIPQAEPPFRTRHDRTAARSFLFVGRLSPQKRVDLLILAVARLKTNNYYAKLHVVGDGPDRPPLIKLAGRLGVSQQVIFHGRIEPNAVAPFYAVNSVFLLSSRDEGQPNALLEAMANAMPAIVCASGGAEYLVDQSTGIVCPPGDSEAIAAAMSQMLAMPAEQFADMGRAAMRRVRSKHALNIVIRQHLELFGRLIRSTSKTA